MLIVVVLIDERTAVQKYFLPAASLLSGYPALSFPAAFTSWFGGGKAAPG